MKKYNIKSFLVHGLNFLFCNLLYIIMYGYLIGIIDYFSNKKTALRVSDCLNVYVNIYSKLLSVFGINYIEPLYYWIFVVTLFISLYILLYRFVTKKYFKIIILYLSLLILISGTYLGFTSISKPNESPELNGTIGKMNEFIH